LLRTAYPGTDAGLIIVVVVLAFPCFELSRAVEAPFRNLTLSDLPEPPGAGSAVPFAISYLAVVNESLTSGNLERLAGVYAG